MKKKKPTTARERAQERKARATPRKSKQYINIRQLMDSQLEDGNTKVEGVRTVAEYLSYTDAKNNLEHAKRMYPNHIVFISTVPSKDWDDSNPTFEEIARDNLYK